MEKYLVNAELRAAFEAIKGTEKESELEMFFNYNEMMDQVNENLLVLREQDINLPEEQKTLTDDDWVLLNVYHDNDFKLKEVAVGSEDVGFHILANMKLTDDETNLEEDAEADIVVVYDYISSKVKMAESWLNYSSRDEFSQKTIYRNVLLPEEVKEDE